MAQSFNNLFSGDNQKIGSDSSPYLIGRVTKVIYGPYLQDGKTPDPDYKSVADIGKIRYVIANSAQQGSNVSKGNALARPAHSNILQLPTQDEYVYLIPGPSPKLNNQIGSTELYYLHPFSMWGSTHHNAFPDLTEYSARMNASVAGYQQSEQGTVNKPNQDSIAYNLGNNYIEKSNVKDLVPFVGDLLLQGRYDNSIRFGSSLKANRGSNAWADSTNDGDPIIIIRNGQGYQSNTDGFIPTVEDINTDQSTIYLTAGQRIDIKAIPSQYPLSSWTVVADTNLATNIIVEMTPAPTANDTMSPQSQDQNSLS